MEIEELIAELRQLNIESVTVVNGMEPVMAGGTSRFDPPYEEGPDRKMVRSGEVTITIKGRVK